jgi:predicted PurR-regulated permease PerM
MPTTGLGRVDRRHGIHSRDGPCSAAGTEDAPARFAVGKGGRPIAIDSENRNPGGDSRFVRRLLIAVAVLSVVLIVFVLRELLVLIFGSIVIAVLLTAMTNPIERWTGLKRGFALTIAILVLLGVIGGAGALFGNQVSKQAEQLGNQIPAAWEQTRTRLDRWGIDLPELGGGGGAPPAAPAAQAEGGGAGEGGGEEAGGGASGELGQSMLGRVGSFVMGLFGVIAHTLLVLAGGVYLAAQPKLYRSGILKLFPKEKRDLVADAYDQSGEALRLWLVGTLVSMSIVGIFTGLGLWLIGVPSALALGLLAGLLEFVPIVGPVAAAVPAILIAFSQSTELALWTLALFVGLQQVESNVIQPVVQRYALDLPPALLLFSVVAGGTLFGIIGVLFAAPLTVVAFVLVKRLYVRETLETETSMPGEE